MPRVDRKITHVKDLCIKTLRLEGEPPVTKWEDFKTLIKVTILSHWVRGGPVDPVELLQAKSGQSVQEYTTNLERWL